MSLQPREFAQETLATITASPRRDGHSAQLDVPVTTRKVVSSTEPQQRRISSAADGATEDRERAKVSTMHQEQRRCLPLKAQGNGKLLAAALHRVNDLLTKKDEHGMTGRRKSDWKGRR